MKKLQFEKNGAHHKLEEFVTTPKFYKINILSASNMTETSILKNHSFSLDLVDENELSNLEKTYKPPIIKSKDEIELETLK